MNRREFIRSLIVTAALVGTAGVGLLEIGNLVENNQNKISLPTIEHSSSQQATSSESSNSATTQVSSNFDNPNWLFPDCIFEPALGQELRLLYASHFREFDIG